MALNADDDAQVIWPGLGEERGGKKAIEPLARDFIAVLARHTDVLASSSSSRSTSSPAPPQGRCTVIVLR